MFLTEKQLRSILDELREDLKTSILEELVRGSWLEYEDARRRQDRAILAEVDNRIAFAIPRILEEPEVVASLIRKIKSLQL